jgi:ABC-type branched-subunit amino acid transport system substrate-binding protein
VLGKPIVGIKGDSGDASTDTANQTVDKLLSQNVDAIIGAASSGVSLNVIDKITGAGVVQFSPANTSKKLSTYLMMGVRGIPHIAIWSQRRLRICLSKDTQVSTCTLSLYADWLNAQTPA